MAPSLARLRTLDLTYAEVGATDHRSLPAGYHHLDRQRQIGHGRAAFDAAAEALMTWGIQRGAGMRVHAEPARATVGGVVLLGVGTGPLRLQVPCRVVAVVEEPDRRGFAYGTLPGHPESGEERFTVTHTEDDRVVLEIVAFSRAATWWSRLSGPVARRGQGLLTERYLRALG
ncbi:MAG: hypothetical protein JWL64_295 [Frankiales bacterium]|nr:hypothetical protein [Frankiales bacterium]